MIYIKDFCIFFVAFVSLLRLLLELPLVCDSLTHFFINHGNGKDE